MVRVNGETIQQNSNLDIVFLILYKSLVEHNG